MIGWKIKINKLSLKVSATKNLLIVVSRKRGKMVDQLSFGVGHPACRSVKHPNNAS